MASWSRTVIRRQKEKFVNDFQKKHNITDEQIFGLIGHINEEAAKKNQEARAAHKEAKANGEASTLSLMSMLEPTLQGRFDAILEMQIRSMQKRYEDQQKTSTETTTVTAEA